MTKGDDDELRLDGAYENIPEPELTDLIVDGIEDVERDLAALNAGQTGEAVDAR